MGKKATIKDIARIAKVSPTAVSMALNNRPGVSEETRKLILSISKTIQYRPNYAAKSLIGKCSNLIGLVIENIADPFYPELALGVEEKASEFGYSLLIYNSGGNMKKETECVQNLKSRGVDGVILSTVTLNDTNIKWLIDEEFPFVLVNRHTLDPAVKNKVNYVVMDDYKCGYQSIEHLYRLGHKRIAIVSGRTDVSTTHMRTKGALQALKKFDLNQDQKLVVPCNYIQRNAYMAAERLLAIKNPPTAFFAQDDNMAIGVREAVLSRNLRIPEDIALVGVNDIKIASLFGVNLTTNNQNIYGMGTVGADILINKIIGHKNEMVNQVIMDTKLVIRKSCGYYLKGYTISQSCEDHDVDEVARNIETGV